MFSVPNSRQEETKASVVVEPSTFEDVDMPDYDESNSYGASMSGSMLSSSKVQMLARGRPSFSEQDVHRKKLKGEEAGATTMEVVGMHLGTKKTGPSNFYGDTKPVPQSFSYKVKF